MKKRLGCLSASALGAALTTLLIIAGLLLVLGGQLFSPGPLNAQAGTVALGGTRSHAETGGHCAACHPAPWSRDRMADRCVACHQDIGGELQDPASLHGTFAQAAPTTGCAGCHTEHRGAAAALTELDTASFPHQATGYALDGHPETSAGQPFACADCHGQDLTHFEQAACTDCHRQVDAAYMQAHTTAFGSECLPCHDGLDTYGARFDHNQLTFALRGKHAAVDCAGCHADARSIADLRGAPEDCFSCHEEDDAHDGQLGQDCGACHTPEDWQQATIDHDRTTFPLTGKHVDVACQDCHLNGQFKGTATDCFACHKEDDAHGGQFGQDCAGCHTPDDWPAATFDHGQTAFPLAGKHVNVACQNCHSGNTYKGTPTACSACHDDPAYHLGLLGTECQDCHGVDGWSPARLNLAHTFPIDHGEAGATPCRTCHPNSLSAYTCYGCHEHVEAEIADKHLGDDIPDFQDCMRCHPTGQKEEGGEGN